jgi:hypothetical protein
MIREDCISMVGRQLIEIVTWFDRVYVNSPVYMRGTWYKVIEYIAGTEEVGLDLSHTELYTVALPRSIMDRTLVPFSFSYSSSHTVTIGLDVAATHELIQALYETLSSDFAFSANYEEFLLKEQAGVQGQVEKMDVSEKVVLIGSSHCARLAKELCDRGVECIDLCTPGWTPTAANVTAMGEKIAEIGIGKECVTVIDILSNITYRYEQFDGSLALPFKANGRYHMGGKVCVCSRDNVVQTLYSSREIFAQVQGRKIVLPPLPRYLYTPCCEDPTHCTGTGTSEHIRDTIESSVGLRKHIQDGLVKSGVTDFSVPDLLQQMLGEKSDFNRMGEKLRPLTSDDSVHLTVAGYARVADIVQKTIESTKDAAEITVPGDVPMPKPGFYWRGFMSPVGSMRVKLGSITYKQNRVGGGGKWKSGHFHRGGPNPGAGQGRGGYRRGFYRR